MAGATKDPSKPPTPSRRSRAEVMARQRPGAVGLFVVVTAAALAADLWTKHAVFASLLNDPQLPEKVRSLFPPPGSPPPAEDVLGMLHLQRPVLPGVFRLTLSTNPGVVFGLPMPPWTVALATVFTIGLVGYFFATSAAAARWTHVALALILAGAVGNFYDRMLAKVFLPGIDEPITRHVRDFLDFSEIGYPWIFNVADVLLVVGVAMLILRWFLAARGEGKVQAAKGK